MHKKISWVVVFSNDQKSFQCV